MIEVQLTNIYATPVTTRGAIVVGTDCQGREYTLMSGELSFAAAGRVVGRIGAAGYIINDDRWNVRAPYGTEAWLIDGMEEAQIEYEKAGFDEASEADYNAEAYFGMEDYD